MKILQLELVGYERFLRNNIHRFIISPEKPIQLIIGTNGSGKSSLLQELSPLPATVNDFVPDGYKKIKLEHQGSTYELTNHFKNKQEHSFIKDGVSLNLQGTSSVQKDLVKQEFNLNSEIYSLISGQSSFCSMTTSDRRYWFTKLADTNYDYALGLYKRLTEKLRDVSGSLKIAKARLVTETSKIVTQTEKELLNQEVEQLHKTLQLLTEYRIPLEKTPDRCEIIFNELEQKAIGLHKQFSNKIKNHERKGLSIEEIDNILKNIESQRTVQKMLSSSYFEKHIKLQETIDLLKQTGGEGSEEFTEKININDKKISEKIKTKLLGLEYSDIKNALIAFETIEDSLMNVFKNLPTNIEGKYSKIKLIELSSTILTNKDTLTKAVTELNRLQAVKQHQEEHKNQGLTECPSCSFKWFKGFVQTDYEGVLLKIQKMQQVVNDLENKIQTNITEKQEILDYSETYKIFSNFVSGWSILEPIWNYILQNKILIENPKLGINLINKIKFDLQVDLEIDKLNNENIKTKELLLITQSIGKADIDKLISQANDLETDIQVCTTKEHDLLKQSNELISHKKNLLEIINLAEQLEILLSSFSLNYTEHKEAFRRAALIDIIKSTQSRLSKKEQLLSEINIQASIIEHIQKQIDSQQIEEDAYRLIVKELSPVEGLIAEGLLGFISNFVSDMNELIEKVWLYPLEIIPCGIGDDGELELDYKFPLKIQNNPKNVPDIAKGSSAMKEITDLAFRITAIKYLGLEDSPLLLDEFGKTFDKEHRLSSAYCIKELMEMKSFTQLFTISHYEATYGSLTNADICVLCNKNITIPTNAIYNQHVLID